MIVTKFTCAIEAERPPDSIAGNHMGRGLPMDDLLDTTLAKRRNEELATWSSQLRDICVVYKLGDETSSDWDDLGKQEKVYRRRHRKF